MKINLKGILSFLLILLSWFIGSFLFKYNPEFYENLTLPSFALPGYLISYIWIIIYILITISIYTTTKKENIFKNKDYFYVLLTNYLANQSFPLVFFYLMSPFLGFVMTTIVFISSIYLFVETYKINKKGSYFLIPYIIYNLYAFILSLAVYIMNF
ncbi:MAG: tryptophan-rich sensory protein [Bacilli bacterium]|nr:tryptophan-rich sensory protein [Bacilli bacterium]